MKVYICTDMEGISGIVVKEQVFPDMKRYEEGRRLLSREVNAAIGACFEAGAADVLVNDGHGAGFNFVLDEMDPRARYRTGVVRTDLTFGLDKSFDAAQQWSGVVRAKKPDSRSVEWIAKDATQIYRP